MDMTAKRRHDAGCYLGLETTKQTDKDVVKHEKIL